MNTDETRRGRLGLAHGDTTSRIIGAAFEVHNALACGFLKKAYQRAMEVELIERGSRAKTERAIKLLYSVLIRG